MLNVILPDRAKGLLHMLGAPKESTRESVDVAIVTIIKEELAAAKIAFGIKKEMEDQLVHRFRYWNGTAKDASGKDLRVVVTMVGESRNVPCASACERLFGAYNVGVCILVGIAAGLEDKVALGDVVAAKLVLDYEGARLERKARRIRPQSYPLDPGISRDLFHFSLRLSGTNALSSACRVLSKSKPRHRWILAGRQNTTLASY